MTDAAARTSSLRTSTGRRPLVVLGTLTRPSSAAVLRSNFIAVECILCSDDDATAPVLHGEWSRLKTPMALVE